MRMCDYVEGQENMAGGGQKASCAHSHGCIKHRMKYSNIYLEESCSHGKKFSLAFYFHDAHTSESVSHLHQLSPHKMTNNNLIQPPMIIFCAALSFFLHNFLSIHLLC